MLSSFLPGGSEETDESTLYQKTEPNSLMSHCILAVMYATTLDSQDAIRDASVMGFLYVAEVDEKKRRMKILAPMTTRIGDRPLVWGSWPEASMSLMA
jgi:polyribonucleotide 5'-hydroxyl-kinase